MQHIISKEKTNTLFRNLYNNCLNQKHYSIQEACQKMNISYEEMKKLSHEDENWGNVFQACRQICANNAEIDCIYGILPGEEAINYMLEGDDEFLELYPTKEAQEELLKYVRLESEKAKRTKSAKP